MNTERRMFDQQSGFIENVGLDEIIELEFNDFIFFYLFQQIYDEYYVECARCGSL